jgi:hypothetical protein
MEYLLGKPADYGTEQVKPNDLVVDDDYDIRRVVKALLERTVVSANVARSRRRNFGEMSVSIALLPYRCLSCNTTFFQLKWQGTRSLLASASRLLESSRPHFAAALSAIVLGARRFDPPEALVPPEREMLARCCKDSSYFKAWTFSWPGWPQVQ